MKGDRLTQFIDLMTKVVLVSGSMALLGTACWQEVGRSTNMWNENAVVNENTNVVAENSNTEVSANANTSSSGEINTSDWLMLTNKELGLFFLYPKVEGLISEFDSDCQDDRCFSGKTSGWQYTGKEDLPRSYILAAVVSDDFAADRDSWPTDYSFFEKKGDKYYLEGNKLIEIENAGVINGRDYIIYKLTSFSPMAVDLSKAYVAMINFSKKIDAYKALTIYFENPNSIEQIIKTVESVRVE